MSAYAAEIALSNNDFEPFRQDYFFQIGDPSTLNNNNINVDSGCGKVGLLDCSSEDFTQEKSSGAQSTATFGKFSSLSSRLSESASTHTDSIK
jgi:hypothetical protein